MHSVTCRTPPPLTPLAQPTLRRNLEVAENREIAALDRPKRQPVAIGQSVDVALNLRPPRASSRAARAPPEPAPKPEHPRRAAVTHSIGPARPQTRPPRAFVTQRRSRRRARSSLCLPPNHPHCEFVLARTPSP